MRGEEEMKQKTIKPESLGGFPDFLPDVMIGRQWVMDKIRETFELYGFLPLDTPCLERSSVLGTDRDDFNMEVYRFNDGFMGSGQDVTLRFDLTVPLSRIVAAYPKLLKPFKRYQVGKVFRKEKPQAGRFREFTQFDADIVGSDSILADVEIIQLMYDTFKNLAIEKFIIKFNNRKILNGLPELADFSGKLAPDVFRALDKLDKIGLEEVVKELQGGGDSGSNLVLSSESIDKIKKFLALSGEPDSLIFQLKDFFKGISIAEEGITECEQIVYYLKKLGIPEANWKFDLSVARGLGYYTGPVFETILTELPDIGSVFSGGRYDELVMRFLGEKIPATGASVGVDRLITALGKLGKLSKEKATAKVLLAIINEGYVNKILRIDRELKKRGISSEIYLGREKTLKGQIIYAAKREIPYVIILGEDEFKLGGIKLKDMRNRGEEFLTELELFDKLEKSD